MDYVNSSGTFFRQKSTQKAPRPKVALPPHKASAPGKPASGSAATWSEVLDFVAVSLAFRDGIQ
jgi:hypothetical protein